MSTCLQRFTTKYVTRGSPPYPGNLCAGQKKLGNDGEMYHSVADSRGIFRWKKASSIKKKSVAKKSTTPKKIVRRATPYPKNLANAVSLPKSMSKTVVLLSAPKVKKRVVIKKTSGGNRTTAKKSSTKKRKTIK